MAVQIPRLRLTVDQYERINEAGIWGETQRVELIDGEMMEMSPVGGPHVWCVNRLGVLLAKADRGDLIISTQNPIRLTNYSEPQPDVAWVRWREDIDYSIPPLAQDVALVIEVADTTLGYDRDVKMPLYAEAGIPEALLVRLNEKRITHYVQPQNGEYLVQTDYHPGQIIHLHTIRGVTLLVDEVLG